LDTFDDDPGLAKKAKGNRFAKAVRYALDASISMFENLAYWVHSMLSRRSYTKTARVKCSRAARK
jgi:hypothetical protein